jgi:hypothetical protein
MHTVCSSRIEQLFYFAEEINMATKEEYELAKCPRCGFETPVEPMTDEEGVLDMVHCAQCGHLYVQTPLGTPGSAQPVLPLSDKRAQRKASMMDKIKQWWQGRPKP